MDGQMGLLLAFTLPLGVLPPLLLLLGVLLSLLLYIPSLLLVVVLLLPLMERLKFGRELAAATEVPEEVARSNCPCMAAAAAEKGDMGVSGDGGSRPLGHWDSAAYDPTASTAALAAAAAWA